MAVFVPEPWVNPFGKMSIFRRFELLFFIAQKVVFSFQNIVKVIFLAYIETKEKVEKLPFLDQNHGLTRLKNVNFSTFRTSSFYSLERRLYVLEYNKRQFPCLYCLKRKGLKMAIFGLKPWVNPFGKMPIFRRFELLYFIAQKGVFSSYNTIEYIFLVYIE